MGLQDVVMRDDVNSFTAPANSDDWGVEPDAISQFGSQRGGDALISAGDASSRQWLHRGCGPEEHSGGEQLLRGGPTDGRPCGEHLRFGGELRMGVQEVAQGGLAGSRLDCWFQ